MNINRIANFIFELGRLKSLERSGWFYAGINNPETVAEHALRAAQLGYILATMENADPEKTASILLIHDNAEVRTGDYNKVNTAYMKKHGIEEAAFSDQIKCMGGEVEKRWKKYFSEFENADTPEGMIARDADLLETVFQAKEYVNMGYKAAQKWIDRVDGELKTESAQKIFKKMKKTDFTNWWSVFQD